MTDINRDGDGSKSPSSPLTQRRLDLLAAGFTPIPAKGKTTHLSGWTQKNITVDEVVSWESTLPDHYNTGVSTSTTPFLDIDVLNAEAADAIEALVREKFSGGAILVRTGQAPKRAIPFKVQQPFGKITLLLASPNGKTEKVELLARGQMVVVNGIHPDTHLFYTWRGGEPGTVKRDELPEITEEGARQLVEIDIAKLLVEKFKYKASGEERNRGKEKFDPQEQHKAENPEKIERALDMIPSDDRDVWFECLCALVNVSRYSPGYDWCALGHRWSAKSHKYDRDEVDAKWHDDLANRNYNYSVATIYHYAKKFNPGWSPRGGKKAAILLSASDIVPLPKEWLWEGHLLRGAQELMTGIPNVGKSQVQIHFAACASSGCRWPNGEANRGAASVIMLTAEDKLEDEVVPRLIAAGADLSRVHILKAIRKDDKNRQFLLSEDLDTLEEAVNTIGDVGLITIDPITAYMGSIDSHRVTDVRSQLGPLKDFAEKKRIAVSTITHPPKVTSPTALNHFIGSQAFIAAGRIGHMCVREFSQDEDGNPTQTGRVLFTNPKNNPHVAMPTLAYRIEEVLVRQDLMFGMICAPRVVWYGEVANVDADEAVATAARSAREERGPRVQLLKDLFTELTKDGPIPVAEADGQAKEMGFTRRQIYRVKTWGFTSFKDGTVWKMKRNDQG